MPAKQVIGEPVVIGGRRLSLSRAVRAGDFVFLTGQVPLRDGAPMTDGTIEDQTHAVLRDIEKTLTAAGCELGDVVKAMVWLTDRADFPGFNAVYSARPIGGGERSARGREGGGRGSGLQAAVRPRASTTNECAHRCSDRSVARVEATRCRTRPVCVRCEGSGRVARGLVGRAGCERVSIWTGPWPALGMSAMNGRQA